MRNIITVIEEIKKVIPTGYKYQEELLEEFEEIIDSLKYTAPEMAVLSWRDLHNALVVWLEKPDIEWKKKISEIMRNGSVYIKMMQEAEKNG